MKKKILIGLGVVVVAGGAFFLYQNSVNAADNTKTIVEVYEVAQQTPLHLKGQVQSVASQTVLLSPEKGPVRTIHVNEGDHVTKDTILVTYEWGEKIKATRDSIVTSLNSDAVNDISKPVMVLKSIESEIRGDVTEYDKEKITIDQTVTVAYVNQDKAVEGRITKVAEVPNEALDASAASIVDYQFIAQPNEAIPVGYSVEILIPRNEIHLPLTSVEEAEGTTFVYTIEKEKAKKQAVNVEKINGYYLVKEGVAEGNEIIKDVTDVKDGMDVAAE
ncbi:HlyD family secretion protein [Enterococcus sp. PF1-24]|uniref:efflux RND transporter periplasmic adaptor subunit n=1 Tax=unclassified Enterococcus TaxID=2608891 RepID=UPI002474F496|nr:MULTISPECIES: efflux RND transporter periplasmic adaptor subunit [unclassified Enterococcus]MDH6365499.1 HlyD family secretion protein [Enterococcus sp. PFB1-1]MDH6402600.1 HlyD family secretion protein [Enterococcus sp. PF1-24]